MRRNLAMGLQETRLTDAFEFIRYEVTGHVAYLTDADRMDVIHNNPLRVVPAFGKV